MMPVTVRAEAPGDVNAIDGVIVAAFRSAAHRSGTEQHIVRALRAANALTVSLVATDGVAVGHVAVSEVRVDGRACNWFGLGPVSVMPSHQGCGIGSQLIEAALVSLRERSAAGCVVLGNPNYYGRFGFRPDADLVLPDVPPAYFQALSFRAPQPRGVVEYHPAFNANA